jgi:hypothetical protein
LALAAVVLAAVTPVWHDWIEILLGVDPDEGSGTVEWTIVVGLLLVAFVGAVAGNHELRRALVRPNV